MELSTVEQMICTLLQLLSYYNRRVKPNPPLTKPALKCWRQSSSKPRVANPHKAIIAQPKAQKSRVCTYFHVFWINNPPELSTISGYLGTVGIWNVGLSRVRALPLGVGIVLQFFSIVSGFQAKSNDSVMAEAVKLCMRRRHYLRILISFLL